MLKSLQLNNFKSHRNTTIEFNGGVTVIGGPSDQGKSIIVTALAWILLNERTDPKPWYRHNTEPTVSITLSDGTKITRGKSWYQINNGERLKAFRTHVPEQVANILNISDINLQAQNDFYFLFQETPGQAAKKVNDFTSLSEMTSLTATGKKAVKDLKSELKRLNSQRTDLSSQLDSLSWLDAAKRTWNRIKNAQNKADELSAELDRVQVALYRFDQLDVKLKRLPVLSLDISTESIYDLTQRISQVKSVHVPVVPDKLTLPDLPDLKPLTQRISQVKSVHVPVVPDKLALPDLPDLKPLRQKISQVKSIKMPTIPNTYINTDFAGIEVDFATAKTTQQNINSIIPICYTLSKLNGKIVLETDRLKQYNDKLNKMPICDKCGGSGICAC